MKQKIDVSGGKNTTKSWEGPGSLVLDNDGKPRLNLSQIRTLVGDQTGKIIDINAENNLQGELMQALSQLVIGQPQACEEVAEALTTGIFNPLKKKGPLGVMFFAGPTGVGKTETVRAISQVLLGNSEAFISIRGEELQDRSFGISKLFGAGDGYVGFGKKGYFHEVGDAYNTAKDAGMLHSSIINLPGFSVLLIDEVEKTHPKVRQALLGVMDEGKIKVTTKKSQKKSDNDYVDEWIDLSNTLIVFTSNIGQSEIALLEDKHPIGFGSAGKNNAEIDKDEAFTAAMKEGFSPEFLGRIGTTVRFQKLEEEHCRGIIDVHLSAVNDRLSRYYVETNYHVGLSDDAYRTIISQGYNEKQGARPLVRILEKMVLTPLGKFLSSPSSDEYNSSQNPVIIYFDSKSGDEQLDFSIHTPHIVDEQPPLLLTAEEPEKEAIAQTNKLTLHNISKVLGEIDHMASMMSILSDDGFSTQEIQILETLDTNFIENIFFEMDGGIFELKGIYAKHIDSFSKKGNNNEKSFIHPRAIQKIISSGAHILDSSEEYSKHLFVLKVISQSFIQVKNLLQISSFTLEQLEFIITLSIAESLRIRRKD